MGVAVSTESTLTPRMGLQYSLRLFFLAQVISCQTKKYCQNRQLPTDGETFYLRERGSEGNWWTSKSGSGDCAQFKYLPKEKLLANGDYRWRWHECGDGEVTIEYVGLQDSGDFWFDDIFRRCTLLQPLGRVGNPCATELPQNTAGAQRHSKNDIIKAIGNWKNLEVYLPNTCFYLQEIDNHCNCKSTDSVVEFSRTVGISKTQGAQREITNKVTREIQVAIRTALSAGFLDTNIEFETSIGTSVGRELVQSFLSSSSATWSKQTTRNLKTRVPSGLCTTLYQAVAQYGEYNVEGFKTKETEEKADCSK